MIIFIHHGLPDEIMPGYQNAKSILDSQINIAKGTKAKVIFIPGNHDWDDANAKDGLDIVETAGNYINSQGGNIKFLPFDGCPGPVEYPINDNIIMMIYDSQWFIRKMQSPGIESDCPYKTPEQFYSELDDMLNRNSKKLVILACHHTLKSYGIHGGYFPLNSLFSRLPI